MLVEDGTVLEGFATVGANEGSLAGVLVPDVVSERYLLRKGSIAVTAGMLSRFIVRIPMPIEAVIVGKYFTALEASELLRVLVDASHVLLQLEW